MRNILFCGCSYTWGQSLHFFGFGMGGSNIHQLDGFYYENKLLPQHYQYNVDNRFSTIVSEHFGRKALVDAQNGGSTKSIHRNFFNKINNETDAVLIQTTQFHRSWVENGITPEEQSDMFEEIVNHCDSINVPIRFIHWDWPADVEIPPSIKNNTIKILGYDMFYDIVTEPLLGGEINDDHKYLKYLAASKTRITDNHFSLEGHKMVASHIIEEFSTFLKPPTFEITRKQNII